jgi:hypothetical protein
MTVWLLLMASAPAADFRAEVVPVLSRAGCNQGACHGSATGKGGFKLSLRGEDPDADFRAITRDEHGRRADAIAPGSSLLLLKATAVVPHGGGRRFAPGSAEYQRLRDWIAAGQRDSAARLTHLAVTPSRADVVAPADGLRLIVSATLADGTRRDVTHLSVFESSAPDVAEVAGDGTVRRRRFGEAAVIVRYMNGQVAVPVAFIPDRPAVDEPEAPPDNVVDRLVGAKLRRLRQRPSPPCDDATFLRRVFLDTLGIIPTANEVRRFLADRRADKRARLIDDVLQREELADCWSQKWADLLHVEVKSLDAKGVAVFQRWLRRQFIDGVPLNDMARQIVAARGSTYAVPPANFYRAVREPAARAEAVAQAFLGVRLQCAKCHNHPFDRWTQDDYHRFAAVFARVRYRVVENRRKDGLDEHEFVGEQVVFADRHGEWKNPRTAQVAPPRCLGDDRATGDDRLAAAADWIADPANPFFARAQVNRVWYHVFGRGIVEPVDDLRPANPPANPELLDALAQQLIASRFDLRALLRLILNSRTYQASSEPNETNRDDEANFGRALVRPLRAEQLLDAVAEALDVPVKFDGQPAGTRAGTLPALAPRNVNEAARFLRSFGKPERLTSCECERAEDTTVVQAFQLVSGATTQRLLTSPANRIGRLLAGGATPPQIAEELYLATLARPPSRAEVDLAVEHAARNHDRRAALEDLVWGLVNSKEFQLRR